MGTDRMMANRKHQANSLQARLLCWMLFSASVSFLSLPARAQERNHFVFGLGVGPDVSSFEGSFGTHLGLGISLKVGHGMSDQFQGYFSALISPVGRKYLGGTLYGLSGVTLRYFLKEHPPSIFINGGADIGFWDIAGESVILPKLDVGFGPRAALGYEFSGHWNAEGALSWISGSQEPSGIFSFWLTLGYEF